MEVSDLQFIDVVLFQFVDEVVDMRVVHVRFFVVLKTVEDPQFQFFDRGCPVIGPWWCRARCGATTYGG